MPGELIGKKEVKYIESAITEKLINTTKPAIIIGIGGTGKEVLLRLRQRFYEKYGEVGLPTMAYLWLDTDQGNYGIVQGKPMDYIQPEVVFQTGELVDCQIEAAPFLEYFRNPNRYKHIWDWLYPQLQAFGQVIDGAAQTPPLGRLAFFHNFPAIRAAFQQQSNKVFGQPERLKLQQQFGMDLDAGNLQVIIVGSMAGGTGTGMLLDTAFLARHMFISRSPEIIGYFLLPTVFGTPAEVPRLYSNAYAKLKELEFYSLRREFLHVDGKPDGVASGQSAHDFVVDWTGAGYPGTPIPGPPFNNCYFIDNETRLGGRIDNKNLTDICDMITESIFVDFSAHAFAARKRSARSNLNEYLGAVVDYEYKDSTGKTIHTDVFSCRFSAFGFSMIHVPLDRIRKTCGYQLGSDIVRYWLRKNDVAGNLKSQIEGETLQKLQLRNYRNQDDYFNALSLNDDTGATFQQLIKDKWQEMRHVLQAQAQTGAGKLAMAFVDNFNQFQDTYFDEEIFDADPRGQFIKRLRKTNSKLFMEGSKGAGGSSEKPGAKARVRQVVAEWLEREVVGISAAVEHLVMLDEIFAEQVETFQELAEYYESAADRTRLDIDGLRQVINDEEVSRIGRWSLRAACDVICQKADKYFSERIAHLIYEEAGSLAIELRDYVGKRSVVEEKDGSAKQVASGLIRDLWRLEEELGQMLAYFEGRRNSFDHAEPHLIFRTLYQPGMFAEYYYLRDANGNKEKVEPRAMKDRLYGEVGWRSLLGVLKEMDTNGAVRARDAVESFCLERFRGHRLDVNVVEKLEEYYAEKTDRNNILDNLGKSGIVWLRPGQKAQAEPHILADYVDDVIIGLPHGTHARDDEMRQSLVNIVSNAGFKCPVGKPIDVNSHVIYLYSEYAGLPIPYIYGLNDYRDAYYREMRDNRHCPHISRENIVFPEVTVEDQYYIEKILKANEVLFMGAILGVLKLSEAGNGSPVQYSCEDRSGLGHDKVLGDRNQAMNTLMSDQGLLDELEAKVDEARAKLDLKKRQELYTILGYHTVQAGRFDGIPAGPYPPEFVNAGGIQRENFTPEYRAIDTILVEERQKLTDQMRTTEEALRELFADQYNDLNDFSKIVKVNGKAHRVFKGPFK